MKTSSYSTEAPNKSATFTFDGINAFVFRQWDPLIRVLLDTRISGSLSLDSLKLINVRSVHNYLQIGTRVHP